MSEHAISEESIHDKSSQVAGSCLDGARAEDTLEDENKDLRQGLLRVSVRVWKAMAAADQVNVGLANHVDSLEAKQEDMRQAFALMAQEWEEERKENDSVHGARAALAAELAAAEAANARLKSDLESLDVLVRAYAPDDGTDDGAVAESLERGSKAAAVEAAMAKLAAATKRLSPNP